MHNNPYIYIHLKANQWMEFKHTSMGGILVFLEEATGQKCDECNRMNTLDLLLDATVFEEIVKFLGIRVKCNVWKVMEATGCNSV